MTDVQEIERAIQKLSPKDLALLREWFEEFDADVWDRQFEEDVRAGKLDGLAEKALANFRAGKCTEL